MDIQPKYRIVKTPCWPRQWKVEGINVKTNNHWSWFHHTWEEAANQIDNLGGILSDDSDFE